MTLSVLITGVTGFIGGTLARRFTQQGFAVTGLVRREVQGIPFPVRITGYAVEELSAIISELKPATIIHAAGSASVSLSLSQPSHDFNDSVALFQRLMEATRISGERPRVVFLSSAAVYGNPAVLPVSESEPLAPISPYGYHKVMGETIAREYSACFNIPTLIVRLFSLFGPAQKRLLVWEIFEQFRDKNEIVLKGTGTETRDYIHIDDLADTLVDLLPRIVKDHLTINIASGRAVTVKEIVECSRRILESEKPVVFQGISRKGDPLYWQADVTILEQMIGRTVTAGFNERLSGTIKQWLK